MKILSKNEYSIGGKENDGILYFIGGNEDKSLYFPFLLYIPNNCGIDTDLVCSCQTPVSHNDKTFDEAIDATAKEARFGPVVKRLSLKYHLPAIIPIIPKYAGFNTAYLGTETYHNDFNALKEYMKCDYCKLSEEDLGKFKDIHEQVCVMFEEAKKFLREQGYNPDDRVIMSGYSAASKFAIFFATLHPNLVKMVIGGGTSGLNIIPLKEYNGYKINYPIGISDVPNFDFEEFKKIQQFYYIGSEDINDPAIPKCVMDPSKGDECGNKLPLLDEDGNRTYITDEEGNYQVFYKGLYTDYDINVINKGLSDNIQTRFDIVKEIYETMEINAEFRKYPGNHVSIWEQGELYEDVLEQYEKLLDEEYKK